MLYQHSAKNKKEMEETTMARRRKRMGGAIELPGESAAFRSNDAILEAALAMFRLRKDLSDHRWRYDDDKVAGLRDAERAHTRHWHRSLRLTPRTVPLADVCRRHRLNRIEAEIVMALLLQPLGLWDSHIVDVSDVLGVLSLSPSEGLAALRALSETGKLCKKGILVYEDPDEELRDRNVSVDLGIVEMVLHGKAGGSPGTVIKSEHDLGGWLARVTRIMQKKSDELGDVMRGGRHKSGEFIKWRRKLDWLLHQIDTALDAHPNWTLSRARAQAGTNEEDWCILLALMGKTLNHVSPDDAMFTGGGLGRILCDRQEEFHKRLERVMSHAPLLQQEYVQPCGGDTDLLGESYDAIQQVEFELTDKALRLLGIEKASRLATTLDAELREPQVRMEDLALPPRTREAVALALDHVRNAKTLMERWGLREAFPYGMGVTMLFHGPPGTGKTATAEAIAHELDKPLLVADYSKIQNCFVGQTEKNIARTFRKARQHGAVLFWDEADAMFYDRDTASRTWEVRDVNVLLQEIERFEGVCILATNRKTTLDKAFERRITAKVEFPRPDRKLREAIWRKLIPKQLPLARDVDLARLSSADLSGGEIKNVILNASRIACGRAEDACVTTDDFQRALDMETRERGTQGSTRTIGFHTKGWNGGKSQQP